MAWASARGIRHIPIEPGQAHAFEGAGKVKKLH